jgi:hypothetical protein
MQAAEKLRFEPFLGRVPNRFWEGHEFHSCRQSQLNSAALQRRGLAKGEEEANTDWAVPQ